MAAAAPTGDTQPVPNPAAPGMGTGSRRVASSAATIAVGLVLLVLLRAFVGQSFFVPTASMAPTVEPGARVLVNKLADSAGLHRGDVIVFDGTSTFAAADRS